MMSDKADLIRQVEIARRLKQLDDYRSHIQSVFDGFYSWQHELIRSTSEYSQCCLIAANRIGKTYLGTYIDAMHAIGDYPAGWVGHKFATPPLIWCLGYSGEKVRDLLQAAIVGRKDGDNFVGGIIQNERIISFESMPGTPNAVRSVQIKHSSGGASTIQFWSYSQGQHALMGDSVDWFHIDEEPKDRDIYPQVLTRTATGDGGRGGRGILTFTPENGRTELVMQFLDTPSNAQFAMQKGWDDAMHLSEQVKNDLLASYPLHQRDMRTKGIPMLGHGRIYDIGEDDLVCDAFAIPAHFKIIGGMDFGYDHPQAQVQLAIDADNDIIYVIRAWKKSKASPSDAWAATKSWQAGIPVAWPADGLQTEKGSGKQQKAYYSDSGFNLLANHATWQDGSNGVEAGLFEIRDMMQTGRFKIFAGLRDLLDEILQYHRDDKGKIVKTRDDLLDAMRYAYMMRRYAISNGSIGKTSNFNPPPRPNIYR